MRSLRFLHNILHLKLKNQLSCHSTSGFRFFEQLPLANRTIRTCFLLFAAFLIGSGIGKLTQNHDTALPASAGASDHWGLSYQEEGKRPVGNASIEQLQPYDAWYAQDTQEPILYLTFDCGYENGNMETILEALKKHQVKATFFCTGHFVNGQPELVKKIAAEGHTVGNHTLTHPDMSKISTLEAFKNELEGVENAYESITGEPMTKFYRPPQGIYNTTNLSMAKELGYHTFFWSLAYVDWLQDDQPTKEEAYEKLLPRIHPGAIVLLHSTSSTNAAILDELLSKWEEMGYHFGTLQELIAK